MSEVKEDNSLWIIVGACIIGIVAVIAFLKSEKSAHLESGTAQQLQAETFANLEKRKTRNNASEEQKAGK
ncbi:hypothetical protein [Methylocucumis oryzae]|uniref:Uncharacterized protein n=1 Tax=Methylocucumis oryzae TaxID=1632867 RepID=A0A0F3ILY7_9GAMM|nr:hypothetical protein [Methylocucumis oryzae]KJV07785.1 hypothetical protein VZ94_02380 [Methylocucumis oryzae]